MPEVSAKLNSAQFLLTSTGNRKRKDFIVALFRRGSAVLHIKCQFFVIFFFRMGNTADAGSDNITFRCARSASKDEL